MHIASGPYFKGQIDEASVYNTALSADQILAIYNAGVSGKCPSPPVITSQPANQSVIAGGAATFSVSANGTQPLSYQWLLNAEPISPLTNGTATNFTLVLSNVQLNQSGGLYSVVVSNAVGSTNSSNALLTVTLPPPCTPPPAGLVSWWAGEGNAKDSFGANNGTLVGGVSFTNGEVGQAFSFTGFEYMSDVPGSTAACWLRQRSTVETWINPGTSLPAVPC